MVALGALKFITVTCWDHGRDAPCAQLYLERHQVKWLSPQLYLVVVGSIPLLLFVGLQLTTYNPD